MFQIKNVHDIIEDTLIRLEEFQSIVAMVSQESKMQTILYCTETLNIFVPQGGEQQC